MLIRPLTFITDFIHTLNASLAMIKPNATLTRAQKVGLSFLLMGMVMTGVSQLLTNYLRPNKTTFFGNSTFSL
jgi:hypothetical protein